MNPTKLSLYVHIAQICIISVMTFYIFPLHILLGDYQMAVRTLLFSIVFWTFAWKFNPILHALLEKWGIKKSK